MLNYKNKLTSFWLAYFFLITFLMIAQ